MIPISGLLLTRLLEKRKRPLSEKEIYTSLSKSFEAPFSGTQWQEMVNKSLNTFMEKGLIEEVSKKKPSHMSRYVLTEAGQAAAREYLGAGYFPKNLTWEVLKNKYLTARSLGLSIRSAADLKQMNSRAYVAKTIVRQGLDLPSETSPADTYFWDAVFWYALGERTTQRFTAKAVKEYLLNKVLEAPRPMNESSAKTQLPAKLTGALNPSAEGLRQALFKRLMEQETENELPEMVPPDSRNFPVESPAESAAVSSALSIEEFAEAVLKAAAASPTGKYGLDKVFISHVWRSYSAREGSRMSREDFKARLLEANRMNCLTLSRADLPDQLNPDDVRASETPYLNTLFHFIRIQDRM